MCDYYRYNPYYDDSSSDDYIEPFRPDPEDVAIFGSVAAHSHSSGFVLKSIKNNSPHHHTVKFTWNDFTRHFPQEIWEGGNDAGDIGVIGAGRDDAAYRKLGEYIGRNTCLRDLDLRCCDITSTRMEALCQGGMSENRSIRVLKLHGNGFDAAGIRSLSPFVRDNPKLRTLDISMTMAHMNEEGDYYPNVADECVRILCDALWERNENGWPCIESLELWANGINDDMVATLMDSFAQFNPGLKELNLSCNQIGRLGCASICTFLNYPKCSLEKIDLYGNKNIKDDALQAFCEGIKNNNKLKILKVEQEPEDDDEVFFTSVGLTALLKLLCDVSSVSATYSSNHSITSFGEDFGIFLDENDVDSNQIYSKIEKYLEMNKNSPDWTFVAGQKMMLHHFTGNFKFDSLDALTKTTALLPGLLSWLTKDAHPIREECQIRCDISERPFCGFFVGYGRCPFDTECALVHNYDSTYRKKALETAACPFFVDGSCIMGEKCLFKHVELEGQIAEYDQTKLSAVYRILLRNAHKLCEQRRSDAPFQGTKKRRIE